MTKLTQTCLCLTLNKKNGNHWQYVRPSTSESSGLKAGLYRSRCMQAALFNRPDLRYILPYPGYF